jgi:hypothetical protein
MSFCQRAGGIRHVQQGRLFPRVESPDTGRDSVEDTAGAAEPPAMIVQRAALKALAMETASATRASGSGAIAPGSVLTDTVRCHSSALGVRLRVPP